MFLLLLAWDYASLTNQRSPFEPCPEVGATVSTYLAPATVLPVDPASAVIASPPHRLIDSATCPIEGALALDVSDVAMLEPTAASVSDVTFKFPAAVVFNDLVFLFASPSAVKSSNLIICEYVVLDFPALQYPSD